MTVTIIQGNALHIPLPDQSIHCCVTSPPYYGLRNYGVAGQLGLEASPEEYVTNLVAVFREVARVLRDDGTLWLNLGDSYAGRGGYSPNAPSNLAGSLSSRVGKYGLKPRGAIHSHLPNKNLLGIPWRVAFALQADGWYLRSDIIWHKPNPVPESMQDRPTRAHEYIFMLTKAERYFYDYYAVMENAQYDGRHDTRMKDSAKYANEFGTGKKPQAMNVNGHEYWQIIGGQYKRNLRSVWTVVTSGYDKAHFATFPPALIEKPILAGCPISGTVLDPFGGTGTTGLVAQKLRRHAVLVELNPEYCEMARWRCALAPEKRIETVNGTLIQTSLFGGLEE